MDLGESGDYFYSLFIKRNPLQLLAPRPDPYGPQIQQRNWEAWCLSFGLGFLSRGKLPFQKILISSEILALANEHSHTPPPSLFYWVVHLPAIYFLQASAYL